MKKRTLALFLTLSMLSYLLTGCERGKHEPSGSSASGDTLLSAETATPTPSSVHIPLDLPDPGGKVYYLNTDLETEEAWQRLATSYTRQTGVQVDVVTASADRYDNILKSELRKSEAPTLFQCSGQEALKELLPACLPLDETEFLQEVTSDVFLLRDEASAVRAVGYYYDSFGLLVNAVLLAEAGHSVQEIRNFASLKAVADDIHARAEDLGFDAFSPAGLDISSSWRFSNHLANLPLFYQFRDNDITAPPASITSQYLDRYKQVWDLYTTDAPVTGADLVGVTGGQAESAFGRGETVFYQSGSWEYTTLTEKYGMDPNILAILPIYCGVEGEEVSGPCCGARGFWSVNANSSEADQQATLAFLKWVVTSEEGTAMLARQFGAAPFRSAKTPENIFLAQTNNYISWGCYMIPWVYPWTPSADVWRAEVVDALTQYTTGADTWSAVETAFVDNWARLYRREHS